MSAQKRFAPGALPDATAQVVVTAVGIALSALIVVGFLGWPDEPDPCTLPGGNCYCEAVQTVAPWIGKQPANTWSNLGAIVAGVVILVQACVDRRRTDRTGAPMARGGVFPIAYGSLVCGLGIGSIAFHGSLTRIGGWLDTLSMILFITFVVLYDAVRIAQRGPSAFVRAYVPINVALGLLTWFATGSGVLVFSIAVTVAVLLELAIVLGRFDAMRRPFWPWLGATFAVFSASIVVWRLSWTGAPICEPTSLLQGHAVWHLLAEAVVPLLLFLHIRREMPRLDRAPT